MKKIMAISLVFLFSGTLLSQYCMLPGKTPYSPNQPGITNFQLNTINRTSGNSESTASVVVVTGMSTTLTAGQAYTISITHSEDAQFFPGARNNLRVWVDFNNNFSWTDPGETILSSNLQAPGTTFTMSYLVPATTPTGTYVLRATAKMSADAGHTLPTPCDSPADPLGYHGEMEDYSITVVGGNPGQAPSLNISMNASVCVGSSLSVTNTYSGTPSPTFNWAANPSTGVSFGPNSTNVTPSISFSVAGSYTISCIATNSVSSTTATKTVVASNCNLAGITESGLAHNIIIAPQPADDHIEIDAPVLSSVMLDNTSGQCLLSRTADTGKISLDLSTLPEGIYLAKVRKDDELVVKRILIVR
jgi:hypothetical protein